MWLALNLCRLALVPISLLSKVAIAAGCAMMLFGLITGLLASWTEASRPLLYGVALFASGSIVYVLTDAASEYIDSQ